MIFKDLTQITVISGKGGAGLVSFKRASNKPKLGPDGGDGGFGGSVYFVGDSQLNSLSVLRYKQEYRAEDGAKGGPNGRTGRNGEDLLIHVPLGTIAIDEDNSSVIGEVTKENEKLLLAKGGKRGLGNIRFLSATHQAPEEHTLGGERQIVNLRVELKLIADVGLAGFPNAGKSSLLSKISAARPKIADYPFTTLTPNLGVVDLSQEDSSIGTSFVVADIPGLIEGASDGKGLGFEFLRHLQRTKIITFVVDSYTSVPSETVAKLRKELNKYSSSFNLKPACALINKIDLLQQQDLERIDEDLKNLDIPYFKISALVGTGIKEFKFFIYNKLKELNTSILVNDNIKEQSNNDLDLYDLDHSLDIDGFRLIQNDNEDKK